MATLNLGNIKFNWKGAYSGGTAYVVDDVVSYSGSSYICKLASTGNLPTDGTYWDQMSSAGTNGTDLTTTLTTQGDILYRDGSGLARLAAGTSGQVLQTGGSGANPSWGTVSSDFVKLYETSTENNPGAGYADYQGYFTDDYDHYRVIAMDTGTGSAGNFEINVGDTGGVDTGSNYNWYGVYANNGGNPSGHGGGSQSFFRVGWNGDGSFKNTTILDMINARNSGVYTHFHATRMCKDGSGTHTTVDSRGFWNNTAKVDVLRLKHGNGNIQINSIAIYGYKT